LQGIAGSKAAPLLEQLKKTPKDPQLLAKIGYVYYATHQFKQAAGFYERSLAARDNVAVRTELGRAYYYAAEPEAAMREFEHIAAVDPGNANALYNLGMIRWKDQSDAPGAIAAWQQLLKTNPNHPQRAAVEQLIASARRHVSK
jgi:cytochrome c-type biogenesis protein CcmH/NrfG